MNKKTIRTTLLLFITVVFLIVLVGWGTRRKANVYSEPLPCFTWSEKLVCFDGQLVKNVVCDAVDASTLLCASTD